MSQKSAVGRPVMPSGSGDRIKGAHKMERAHFRLASLPNSIAGGGLDSFFSTPGEKDGAGIGARLRMFQQWLLKEL